jgi:hypothetical protein
LCGFLRRDWIVSSDDRDTSSFWGRILRLGGRKMSRAGPGKRKAQFNDVRLFGVDFVLRLCFNVHDVQRRQNEDFGSSIQSNLVRY